jgi:hypothetical protein
MVRTTREIKIEGVEKHNPNNYGGMCSRQAVIQKPKERNLDDGIDVVAATEAAVLVMDWERYQIVREVLPMRYLDMSNADKVPLLDTHTRNSVEKVKGSASDWKVDGNQLTARITVSKSEPATRTKIEEGHIDSVSIGYMTDSSYTVEVPKGANVTVDGIQYRNDYTDGIPLLIRTWWERTELSLVPIGADADAKFRSNGVANEKLMEEITALKGEIAALKPVKRSEESKTISWHEARLRIAINS